MYQKIGGSQFLLYHLFASDCLVIYSNTCMDKKPTENKEQMCLMDWVRYRKDIEPYIFAIPNGGYRIASNAAVLKKTGVRAGVSDLFVALPMSGYCGLWIEMKRNTKTSKITKEQKNWFKLQRQVGYATFLAYGWESAKNAILQYLENSKSDFEIVMDAQYIKYGII